MSDPPRREPPGRGRGEGQWALGYFEPLNPPERAKRDQDPLDIRETIERVHAKRGIDSIMAPDMNTRYRWYGLYTQRPPDFSPQAEHDDINYEFFMMRIRVPGGVLTADQVESVGRISLEFGRDVCDITDRQNFQLHWIRIEDVPEIWARLEQTGLSTANACGDVTRNILGCPLAGVAEDEIIDATPYLLAVDRRVTGTKEFSNLPRKYKLSISGCREQCAVHEVMDVGLVGVEHPDGRPGFDLWVGGGLSTTPRFGDRLDAFVPPDRVVEVVTGITGLFRDWGYRRSRNKARLKFLVRDWGPERFRDVLEKEYLEAPLEDGPAAEPSSFANRDHIGSKRQKDGRYALGFAPMAGRISGTQLLEIAQLARAFGRGRIRTTTQQKMLILDVPDDRVEKLAAELESLDLPTEPSAVRAGTIACTGIEFCKLAVVETKHRARWLIEELEKRLPGSTDAVRINLNGCPNSCARYQIADIGLMGSLVPGETGRVDGFQVHLGGSLGRRYRFGDKQKALRVAGEKLPDFIAHLIGAWMHDRDEGQDFTTWVSGLPETQASELIEAAPK
ncbi:MAG: nitrite/sulfite reductase [Actinomycetota bacterium]